MGELTVKYVVEGESGDIELQDATVTRIATPGNRASAVDLQLQDGTIAVGVMPGDGTRHGTYVGDPTVVELSGGTPDDDATSMDDTGDNTNHEENT